MNSGSLRRHSRQASNRLGSDLYTSQTSPLGPRPNFGGSRMMPSYLTPRRASRCTNFDASSTIQRMGVSVRLDKAWFSRAQLTDFFEASTCVTLAPAAAADNEARPVYPKRFNTLTSLFSMCTLW